MTKDKVVVHIDGDDSGFKKSLSGIGNIAQKGLGLAVKGIAAIGTGFTVATGAALKFSGSLEQNIGGSKAVFEEFADDIQKKADTAFKNMGLSASDYLATANKMGSLFKGAGFEIEESVDMTTAAMQRAADVASIMGIDTAWAMESIAGAAKGNFTMMDNLGVAMNETTLNAYALEIGLNKTTAQMTNQEKVALAMEMFLDRTSYAAGNYAKENETLAGALGTAKAALQNFISGAGDVDEIVDALSNASEVIIKNLGKLLPKLVAGLSGIAKKLVPMIPDIIGQLIPPIIEVFEKLVSEVVKIAPEIAKALANGIGDAIPALKPFADVVQSLTDNIGSLTLATASAVATFKLMMLIQTIAGAYKAATGVLSAYTLAVTANTAATTRGITVNALLVSTMKPFEILVGVLTHKINLQTAATVALAAAKKLLTNHMGLVVTGVIAATAAIATYIVSQTKETSATKIATEELKKTNEELKKRQEEEAKLRAEREKSAAADIAQVEYVKSLKDELVNLADASGNVQAKDAARAQFILNQLNTALGTEYTMTGNIISNYQTLQSEIVGLIEKKKLQILTDALLPEYEKAIQNQKAETIAMTKAALEVDKTEAELKELYAKKELEQLYNVGNEKKNSHSEYTTQIKEKEAYLKEQQEAEKNHASNVKQYTSTITTFENAQQLAFEGNVQGAIECLQLKDSAYKDAVEKVKGNVAEEERVTGEYYSNAIQALAFYAQKLKDGEEGYTEEGLEIVYQHALDMQREAEAVGMNLCGGIISGINGYQGDVKAAVDALASLIPEWMRTDLKINSPSRVMRDKIGKSITEGIAVGIDDGKTEVQKVMDEMNEELLEGEKFYRQRAAELDENFAKDQLKERIKNAETEEERQRILNEAKLKDQEEANQIYLDALKEAAEEERKIYEAKQKDIENAKQKIKDDFAEMADAAMEALEDIESTQQDIAERLDEETTFRTYKLVEGGVESEHHVLGDGGESARELENYSALIDKLFEKRGEIPDQVMEFLSGMDIEEGTKYINAMLKASDAQFDEYINNLQREADAAAEISKKLTHNQIKEWETTFGETFGQVPEDFFDIGEESAKQYGEGFMAQIKGVLADVQEMMTASLASIGSRLVLAGAGNVNTTNYTDNRTTTIYASDSSEHGLIEAQKANEEFQAHTRSFGG